jgi:hypothetical protein
MTLVIRETRPVEIEYIKKGQKEVDIFVLTQLSAESGIRYLKKVQKIVLPVWAEATKGEGVTLADILVKASEKLDELDEKDIISLICESTNTLPSKFNDTFNGKYVVIGKLLKEIVFFNFEDVFTELGLEEI